MPDQTDHDGYPEYGASAARPNDLSVWIGIGAAVGGVVLLLGMTCSGLVVVAMLMDHKPAEVDERDKDPNVARNDKPLEKDPAVERLEARNENEFPHPPGQPPFAVDPVLANSKGKVYLSDLQEFGWKPGPVDWRFGKNGELGSSWVPNGRILINGAVPPKGLSMHPPIRGYSRVCYALGRTAKSVTGSVAMSEDERHSTPQPTRFLVLGDGKLLWRSPPIQGWPAPHKFSVDVSEIDVLELRTYAENGHFGSHAAWVDPYVER